jgi:hypothetical protein
MEQNILTWNVANWITVILMAAGGFAILKGIQVLYQRSQAASS